MGPEVAPNCNPTGAFTVRRGRVSGLLALKNEPSANTKRSPVVARKDPPSSNRALGPKTMPLGLSKNRFALPFALKIPSILEIEPPVMRVRIWLI